MVAVTWYEASADCRWLGGQVDQRVQLPSEAQWEKAARGTDGRKYPWGNHFDSSTCATAESGTPDPCVGENSPEGDSPYGVADMLDNVLQWTSSLWSPYPYDSGDGREDPEGDAPRVLRGSSAGLFSSTFTFVSRRGETHPGHCEDIIGFRFVVVPSEVG
jgi:formylglycine-generating enzyme required for sulfatase activity